MNKNKTVNQISLYMGMVWLNDHGNLWSTVVNIWFYKPAGTFTCRLFLFFGGTYEKCFSS